MPGRSGFMLWLGFDPGGDKAFGVALIHEQGVNQPLACHVGTTSCADEACDWAWEAAAGRLPDGAGIDTLMFWSSGPSGWRPADLWLRQRYKEVCNSVQSPNGLWGAMLMQGMALAIKLRRCWPSLPITETHPKILYHTMVGRGRYRWPEQSNEMSEWLRAELTTNINIKNDHEFDALFSAQAARKGFSGVWQNDLRHIGTKNLLLEPAGPVRYWWPE
jgi:hypothetical protein